MNETKLKEAQKMVDAVAGDPETPENIKPWAQHLSDLLHGLTVPEERFVKGAQIPVSLGDLADEYSVVRQKRLDIEKDAKAVKEREMELYNSALETLNESSDTGAMGKLYAVQRVEKEVNNVADWPSLWKHIRENDAFELLGKSINQKAVREQIEAGEEIPGVEQNTIATLSFTKV